MPDFSIRRMTKDDLDEIVEVEKATFDPPWSRESFESELDKPYARYLVGLVDGHCVGYAGCWCIFDESRVTNIGVSEAFRGNGYGRALTDGIIRYAANLGASVMTLEVRVSNERAMNLYRSLGFRKVHEIKKHYADGESAWLMLLDKMPPIDPDFEEPETVHE